MIEDKISKTWAQALLELAVSAGRLEQVRDGAQLALAGLSGDPVFGIFFSSPRIDPAKKREVFASAFGGSADELILDFAGLMMARNRGEFLASSLRAFQTLYDEIAGKATATVVTAVPLSPELAKLVKEHLQRVYDREIDIDARVDPRLIGGMIARVGDSRIDSSLLRDLKDIRSRMLAAKL